uniref:Protein MNN4-like n=1 Tax=Cucumis melo TaxID=3656 RepID=A0A9I9DDN9_CUCME
MEKEMEEKKEEKEKKKRKDEKNKKEKDEARRKEKKVPEEAQKETMQKEGTSSAIVETKFERLIKKTQQKTEKVKSGLLKIKVKAHGVKALVQEKKETKLRKREELLSKVEKVTLSTNKGKGKEKTFDEHCNEFEK